MADEPGVPLSHYLTHSPPVGVRFHCDGCQRWHDVDTADVVARLKAAGLGDEQTGIREVARLSRRPCARCGAVKWETRPAFKLPGQV